MSTKNKILKFKPKDFQKDYACDLDFVRIYHDFTWRIGAVIKGLKSKKCYEVILLYHTIDEEDDPFWKLHEINKNNYSLSCELGEELISKIETYMRKEDTGKWLVICKINPPSRVKTVGCVSMIVDGKLVPIKMEQLNVY